MSKEQTDAYIQGLEDGKKLILRLGDIPQEEREKLFGTYCLQDILILPAVLIYLKLEDGNY